MTSDYADRATQAAESIDPKTSTAVTIGGIKVITYALLDVAAAIREHGRA